jgi:hypothetical protein
MYIYDFLMIMFTLEGKKVLGRGLGEGAPKSPSSFTFQKIRSKKRSQFILALGLKGEQFCGGSPSKFPSTLFFIKKINYCV